MTSARRCRLQIQMRMGCGRGRMGICHAGLLLKPPWVVSLRWRRSWGGSLRHQRRSAFAPGGKGFRFGSGAVPRFHRLGDWSSPNGRGFDSGGARPGASPSVSSRAEAARAPPPLSPMMGSPREALVSGMPKRSEVVEVGSGPVLLDGPSAGLDHPLHFLLQICRWDLGVLRLGRGPLRRLRSPASHREWKATLSARPTSGI
jgi:hypothetical protein